MLIVSLKEPRCSNLDFVLKSSSKIMLYVVDMDVITIPEPMKITVSLGGVPTK